MACDALLVFVVDLAAIRRKGLMRRVNWPPNQSYFKGLATA